MLSEASDVTMAPSNLPSWWCLWQKSCLKNSGNQYHSSWPITLTQQVFYYQMSCKHLPCLRPTVTGMNKRLRPLKMGLNFRGRINKPYNKWVFWRWPRVPMVRREWPGKWFSSQRWHFIVIWVTNKRTIFPTVCQAEGVDWEKTLGMGWGKNVLGSEGPGRV